MEPEKSKKPSRFNKIRLKYLQMKGDFIKKLRELGKNPEVLSFMGICGEVVTYGVLLGIASIPLFGFSVINMVSLGAGFWMLKEKVVPVITQILSAFRLAVVYK